MGQRKTSRLRKARPSRTTPAARRLKIGPHFSQGAVALRGWRKRKGLSQWQATVELGFRYDKLSSFELGVRRPSLVCAIQIHKVTGIAPGLWTEPAPRTAVEDGRSLSFG
jgi:hypothetical protein